VILYRLSLRHLRLLPLALLCSFTVFAQTAALTGQVSDDSGAIVPGAKVTLNGPAGVVKSGAAANDGSYSFRGLPVGRYSVLAAAPDLEMAQPVTIVLHPGTQSLTVRLAVARTSQQITVHSDAGPTVSTESSNNASALVLTGEDLEALPDDPDDLQADLQALAGPAAGPSGGAMYVDGFSGGELPPKESIREIRINQNPFSPEYDKLGYGRIDIFTKPGTGKIHGNIGWNFADQIWNSRNPYAAEKAPLLLNESENSASGPLTKRASFTLDLEYHAVNNGAIINALTLNPQTLNPEAFTGTSLTPQRRFRISPRVDYQLNENNTLSLRYTFTKSDIQDFGIGAFDLSSRGYRVQNVYNTFQATETAVIGTAINETRFQYYRWANQSTPNNEDPEIQVLGAFNGGGSQTGRSSDLQNNFELQNYTSLLHGAHSFRFGVRLRGTAENNISQKNFGGTFTFSSIDSYRLTELGLQQGLTPDQIRAMGGGASQFSMNAGIPGISVNQTDAGLFAGDEWRVAPNFTVNLGVRYETQTNIRDHFDLAPRVGLAWALGGRQNQSTKTVLRAGFGIFYDRFALTDLLTAQRYNGIVQQQYVVTNPNFYPIIPAVSSLAGNQSSQVIQQVDANLRAPYVMQTAVSLERQLPKKTTLAVTYTNSHALHVLRTDVINAPLPGTYNPSTGTGGIYPLGGAQPIFEMTSSGVYNQNQLITNVNSKLNSQISLFGFYVLNRAMSNSDGLITSPANPYNFNGEYGPAALDIRHRFLAGGSINTKWNVRFSPYVILQSGAPFDVTTGNDLYGTTLFNSRPGIATDPSRPGLVQTQYGLLDPNPIAGEQIISRNYGRGPGLMTVNLRVGKTIGFGPRHESASSSSAPAGLRTGVDPTAPGGMRGLFSSSNTDYRYSLTIGMSARNLLNHTNPGQIIGNIQSPLFGRANQVAGTLNGEGFSENASNRRLELQIKLSF
jgi:Carboxypeptidase regulatory-like domain